MSDITQEQYQAEYDKEMAKLTAAAEKSTTETEQTSETQAAEKAAAADVNGLTTQLTTARATVESLREKLANTAAQLGEEKKKTTELKAVRDATLPPGALRIIKQHDPLGLGHAVWCAWELIGDEPFALRPYIDGLGAISHNSIFRYRDDVGFVWMDGSIHSLAATASYGDFY